jgi:hypothetical protein
MCPREGEEETGKTSAGGSLKHWTTPRQHSALFALSCALCPLPFAHALLHAIRLSCRRSWLSEVSSRRSPNLANRSSSGLKGQMSALQQETDVGWAEIINDFVLRVCYTATRSLREGDRMMERRFFTCLNELRSLDY